MSQRFGATDAEWTHFSLCLGLTKDLLPVVSRPGARISPSSSLRTLGKTPSRYNAQGDVVGIHGWTKVEATQASVEKWSAVSDYGICLQTRSVRAVDLDISDEALLRRILGVLLGHLGDLPIRGREGAARVALGFMLPGQIDKRVVRTAGGAVEFLATGQQFVVAGTHPSGGRYVWDNDLPDDFPVISLAQFEICWNEIEREFAVDGPAITKPSPRKARGEVSSTGTTPRADPVLDWLRERGWLTGDNNAKVQHDGKTFITCPWKEDHTLESGPTETIYYPRGTGGFEEGHFKCLHAHCSHRSDADFLDAIGWRFSVEGDFDVLGAEGLVPNSTSGPRVRAPALPALLQSAIPGEGLKRSKKGYVATIQNVTRALGTADWWYRLGLDTFRDELMKARWGTDEWVPFGDADYTLGRIALESAGFEPVGRELMRDAVLYVAGSHRFDSAQVWLQRLSWDGVPRVESFLERYCGAAPGAYGRAVSRYLWTALAGRVLSPGCQADMVPILVGAQGVGKTRGVAALAPAPEFSVTIDLAVRDADLARRLRGRLVVEIAELRGLHTRDLTAIKDFITQRFDTWTPKYREFATSAPRRFVMIGTTNEEEFLADETGNRRWLPVRVGRVAVDDLTGVRDQLWAEGAARWLSGGVDWAEGEALAGGEHEGYTMEDSWQEALRKWLETDRSVLEGGGDLTGRWGLGGFTTRDALVYGVGLNVAGIDRRHELRMARCLRVAGYRRSVGKDTERRSFRCWVLAEGVDLV